MLLLGWSSEDMPRHYGAPVRRPSVPRRSTSGWGSVNVCSAPTDRACCDVSAVARASRGWASPDHLVTAVMSAVMGLTFVFGFGNVWHLASTLGVPGYIAPLIAPAVDLSVLGLIVGTRHLAMRGFWRC